MLHLCDNPTDNRGIAALTTLTHIALHVRDLQACVDFYCSYAGLDEVHRRHTGGKDVVWLAEAGREREFILVILPGGPGRNQLPQDFSHLGFALESHTAVDAVAERARRSEPADDQPGISSSGTSMPCSW